MSVTGIPNQDGLFLYCMAALPIGRAWVDRVFEVEAFADGVAFDDFVAHFAYGIRFG